MRQKKEDSIIPQVFEQLTHGKHICDDDGAEYHLLRSRFDELKSLFEKIGYQLVRHPADFYYFEVPEEGPMAVSPVIQKAAILVYILIEHLADQGEPIVDAMLTKEFDITQRPFIGHSRYTEYWRTVEVEPTAEGIQKVLQTMSRLGFVQRIDENKFFFRSPVRRFFDIARQALPQQNEPESTSNEA